MNTFSRLVLVALMVVCGGAQAQQEGGPQTYDVEIIVFRHLSAPSTSEQWAMETGYLQKAPDAESADADAGGGVPTTEATTSAYPALNAGKYKLTAVNDTLKRNRNYQPLAHFGWTQPGVARNESRYVSLGSLAGGNSNISGQLALSRGRYLHLTLDLSYRGEDGQVYVLKQTRRMRSTERHYIDHPKFGVIALVTPSTP